MRHWKLILGGLAVVVLVLGAAAAFALSTTLGEAAAGDVRPGPAASPAARLVMRDNVFDPASVSVPAGQAIEIEIENDGAVDHNFTNEALRVSTGPTKPGEVKTVALTIPAGTTRFVCTWHAGMTVDVTGQS
jgi:plastocyanin